MTFPFCICPLLSHCTAEARSFLAPLSVIHYSFPHLNCPVRVFNPTLSVFSPHLVTANCIISSVFLFSLFPPPRVTPRTPFFHIIAIQVRNSFLGCSGILGAVSLSSPHDSLSFIRVFFFFFFLSFLICFLCDTPPLSPDIFLYFAQ